MPLGKKGRGFGLASGRSPHPGSMASTSLGRFSDMKIMPTLKWRRHLQIVFEDRHSRFSRESQHEEKKSYFFFKKI